MLHTAYEIQAVVADMYIPLKRTGVTLGALSHYSGI